MTGEALRRSLSGALLLAALGMAAFVAGCGGGQESGSGAPPQSPYDVGARAAEEPVDTALASRGQVLFKTKTCSTCHAFGLRITGPDLSGVTRQRTSTWIQQQILHPDIMTKSDPISHELLGEYHVQMPNLMLKPGEAKALLEFIKRKDRE